MPSLPNLYVFLVGVNHYPNLIDKLQLKGPINDVRKMENFFLQSEHLINFQEVHIHKLCSPAPKGIDLPSKSNIVKGFTDFLGQAQAGDTVVFYYAGHGVREHNDIVSFQSEEIDGCIGSITAHDIRIPDPVIAQGEAALSDKEMRYLIRQLAEDAEGNPKAHVLTIFDCCHSGHHTRAPQDIPENALVRQVVKKAIPARQPESFIFAKDDQVWAKLQNNASLQEVLPLANHVMLAACREVELAWERFGKDNKLGGVFTSALIEVLHAHQNQISYHDLHSRVLNRMRFYYSEATDQNDVRQTPQLFIKGTVGTARYHTFLTNAVSERSTVFPLEYMEREQEWRLAAGALHGLHINQETKPNLIQVWDVHNPDLKWPASALKIYPTHALLAWPQETPAANGTYKATVEGLNITPLSINLQGEKEGVELLREQLNKIAAESDSSCFQEVPSPEEADYVLHAYRDLWYTLLPGDLRPLLIPIQYRKLGELLPHKARYAYEDLKQMAMWHYLKDLEGTASTDNEQEGQINDPIELCMFIQVAEQPEKQIPLINGQFVVNLLENESKWSLFFTLKNNSTETLNCNLTRLSYSFGFYPFKLTKHATLELSSGETFKTPPIPWGVDSYISQFHWPGERNFLKLTCSQTPLNIESFEMEGLPTPYNPTRAGYRNSNDNKKRSDSSNDEPCPDWTIRTFELYIVNPQFDFGQAQRLATNLIDYQ